MPIMASTFGCVTIACAQVWRCSRLVCPVTSTGFPSAANGGTIGRSDCSCSLERRQLDAALLAMIRGDHAGPPASEKIAARLPRGRLLPERAKAAATSNSSSLVSTKVAPASRSSDSQTRPSPASEPVCDSAARWPDLRAAALEDDDRLLPAHLGDGVEEDRHVGHAFDEGGDHARFGILGEIAEQVRVREVGHVADAGELGQADARVAQRRDGGVAERAALRDEGDRSRLQRRVRHRRRVHRQMEIPDAETVRADHADAAIRARHHVLLQLAALLADLLEAGGEHDGGLGGNRDRVADAGRHGGRRNADQNEIDCVRNVLQRGERLCSRRFPATSG